MRRFIIKLLAIINSILGKNKNKVCFVSHPDFSDNSMSVFDYMVSRKMQYEIIWLVNDSYIPSEIYELKKQFKIKVIKLKSLQGILNYMTSKYIFYTHGAFNGVECLDKQIVVNLWHGMPLKNIGYLDNKTKDDVAHFTYTIATSEEFQNVISKVFGVDKSKVLITGLPRNDRMDKFRDILNKLGINVQQQYNKKILWMPTFRKSSVGDKRNDGISKEGQLPLLSSGELKKFNIYLNDNKILLIVKLHPMDSLQKKDFCELSNIKIFVNDDFKNIEEQLYSIFHEIDALITDYSSVYFDFMILNKPIGFVMDDLGEYSSSRGFVFDNIYEWIPGPIIKDVDQLHNFVEQINNNTDDYKDIRERVNNKTNKYSDFNNTERLFAKLEL